MTITVPDSVVGPASFFRTWAAAGSITLVFMKALLCGELGPASSARFMQPIDTHCHLDCDRQQRLFEAQLAFKDRKLRELCEHKVTVERKLGAACARKLRSRLADLQAATDVAELVAGHPHPLHGDRAGQFALDLEGGRRLVLEPDHEPIPHRDDGSTDWSRVTRIRIAYLGDYDVGAISAWLRLGEIAAERLDGPHLVHSVAGGQLFICLECELALEPIRAMAGRKPERVVCLDEGFAGNDQLKANAVQIFKTKGVASFKTV